MTHDELLAEIEKRYWEMFNYNSQDQTKAGIEHRQLIKRQYFALRDVVKLHKPYLNYKDEECFCLYCGENQEYPCPTIQAIEKRFKVLECYLCKAETNGQICNICGGVVRPCGKCGVGELTHFHFCPDCGQQLKEKRPNEFTACDNIHAIEKELK